MAQASTHSLLSLPDDEIIKKLRKMSIDEIFKFSLISKKCKNLVSSLKIKGTSINVSIGSDITICIGTKRNPRRMSIGCYTEPDMYWGMGAYGRKKKLTVPQSVIVVVSDPIIPGNTAVFWVEENLTMKEWLKHLQDVFSYHKIDSIQFCRNSAQFDIDDIKEVFKNPTDVDIGSTGCFDFNQIILEKYCPIKKLAIRTESFEDSKIPPSVLIQNFVEIWINKTSFTEPTVMKLDELLITNSKVIEVEGNLPAKQFNMFIKLWRKGSNPNMEFLRTHYRTADKDLAKTIMKGIKHEVIPEDRIRFFKHAGSVKSDSFQGGMDVHRNDGTKATIQIIRMLGFTLCLMKVWFDHCAVES